MYVHVSDFAGPGHTFIPVLLMRLLAACAFLAVLHMCNLDTPSFTTLDPPTKEGINKETI